MRALEEAKQAGWLVMQQQDGDGIAAQNRAIDKILSSGVAPLGFAVLQAGDALQPDFITHGETVLRSCPTVGIVSCWAQHQQAQARFWMKPCPSFPYQWVSNDIAPFSVVRTEALSQVGYFRPDISAGNELWDLFNAVMASGWAAVTIPRILGKSWFLQDGKVPLGMSSHTYAIARQTMLARFPEFVQRDMQDMVLLLESEKIWASSDTAAMQEQFFRGHILLHYSKGGIWFGGKTVVDQIIDRVRQTKYRLSPTLRRARSYLEAVLKTIQTLAR